MWDTFVWDNFVADCSQCINCKVDGLIDETAFPILAKDAPSTKGILFILEAPNSQDIYNIHHKNLSINQEADSSGNFFHDLYVNELKFPLQNLFVTNSVLCLPAKKNGKYPVTSAQRSNCQSILRRMIEDFDPLLVCPLGSGALAATNKLEKHEFKKMADAVAKPTRWYQRTLFPLFLTSRQARNHRNGRSEAMQRSDWRTLKNVWKILKAQH